MRNKNQLEYLNALNKINGLGSQRMKILLNFFDSPENIWRAGLSDLKASKVGNVISEKLSQERKTIDPDQEWEKLEKERIEIIILDDPAYPRFLKEIPNPPYIIYKKGNFDLNSAPMISIVGSRKFTSYGAQAATSLARDLAGAGVTVVSGMALGIDAVAHRGALDAGGKTVAVLGNSLEDKNIAPRTNFSLSREIVDNGALVSEFPPDTSAAPGNFPARNRIIAGLSLGTLVIEAGEKSGSLITAALALEFNREVFAVPGSIFSAQSAGAHGLLRNGAKIVTNVKDILEELNLDEKSKNSGAIPKIPENKEEEILLQILGADPLHIDNIAKLSKLGTATAAGNLALMEMKGWVKNIGGQNYILL